MTKAIPGYYFDEEKKRYFRIQPNQVADGVSGAQHSAQAVKERLELSKKRKRDEAYASRGREQRITRSRLLQHPGLGGHLSTTLTCAKASQRREIKSSVISSALCPTEAIKVDSSTSVTKLLHEPLTDGLFTFQSRWPHGIESESVGTICAHARNLASGQFKADGTPLPGFAQGLPVSMEMCRVSDDLKMLIAVCSTPAGGTIYLRQMHVSDDMRSLSPSNMEIQFLLGGVTLWSSSASPVSPQFVVASSNGLCLTYADENSWNMKQIQRHRRREEFLNAEWQERNVISAGRRDGCVLFTDTRSEEWVTRLRVDKVVSAIRKINEHQVVVRSVKSMNMYDLRYAKSDATPKKPTKPWLSFPDYMSTPRQTGNFDYDESLGLIATGKLTILRIAMYLVLQQQQQQQQHRIG